MSIKNKKNITNTIKAINELVCYTFDPDTNHSWAEDDIQEKLYEIIKNSLTDDLVKKKKDKNKPKKGRSAYIFFCSDNRQRAIDSLSADGVSSNGFKQSMILSKLGQLWKLLNTTEKIPYNEKATEDKERSRIETEEYKRNNHEVEEEKHKTKNPRKKTSKQEEAVEEEAVEEEAEEEAVDEEAVEEEAVEAPIKVKKPRKKTSKKVEESVEESVEEAPIKVKTPRKKTTKK